MRCVQRRGAENVRGRSERILATMLAGLVFLLGCPPGNPPLSPQAGFSETHMVATVPVPGGALVNVAGGNLLVPRVDLSIDTPIGPLEIAAVWNSTTRQWTFNFDDMRYLTGSLTDATGGTLAIGVLAPGSPLAGTHWVKVSETVVQTKGGLRYEFGADGHLRTIRWASSSHPRLDFDVAIGADGHPHTQSISQCLAGTGCEVVYAFSYDAHGRPVQVDDRAGRTATYSWEAAGKLVAARDGLDMTQGWPGTRYEYSPGGDLVAIVNSEGER